LVLIPNDLLTFSIEKSRRIA